MATGCGKQRELGCLRDDSGFRIYRRQSTDARWWRHHIWRTAVAVAYGRSRVAADSAGKITRSTRTLKRSQPCVVALLATSLRLPGIVRLPRSTGSSDGEVTIRSQGFAASIGQDARSYGPSPSSPSSSFRRSLSLAFLTRPSYWLARRWEWIWPTVSMVTETTISRLVPPK